MKEDCIYYFPDQSCMNRGGSTYKTRCQIKCDSYVDAYSAGECLYDGPTASSTQASETEVSC